jgi:Sigma-70, region 4
MPPTATLPRADRPRIRHIVDELPERRRALVKLRFQFGRGPAEIQRHLDVSERVYRRELRLALEQLATCLELGGRGCPDRHAAILTLIAGVPDRGRDATRGHLAECPACARAAAELRGAARRGGELIALPDTLPPATDGIRHAARLVQRADPAKACFAALVMACGGAAAASIAPAQIAGGEEVDSAQPSEHPRAVAAATAARHASERRARRRHAARRRPQAAPAPKPVPDEFGLERRTPPPAPPAPPAPDGEFGLETQPVAAPPAPPPTPEELEFGLERAPRPR